ncbi:MAG: methyltransferase [Chlorobi bacterium]|nr:methyltransferase [Chlorobiota bacterium]
MNKTDTRKFHLKPFSLSHHRSTMKVGTDAILLGLWAPSPQAGKVLDVGTGCGIISLLIASRCQAIIDAIELDPESAAEAAENFRNTPFSYRMRAIEKDFSAFAKSYSGKYDLIISNPPFFISDLPPEDEKKKKARHHITLTFKQLIAGTAGLLSNDGKLCVVLPYDKSEGFTGIARQYDLHPQKQQLIFPFRGSQPNRINLCLGFRKPEKPDTEKFIIREENKKFSKQYIEFLKDYYIGLGRLSRPEGRGN